MLLRYSTPNYFTGHVCKQTISKITLVVIEYLDGIRNVKWHNGFQYVPETV